VQGRQQAQQQHDSSDEEDGGKLSALQQNKKRQQQHPRQAGSSVHQPQQLQAARKVFDRAQLLAVPTENLSKWQRKQLRKKEKARAAVAAQQQ
jgi:hypothetical protein